MSGVNENPFRQFTLDEIKNITHGFSELRLLGEGGFGKVYKGVIIDESTVTLVAVKRSKNPESIQGIQSLKTEIQMLRKCRHSNIVSLLGYCDEDQEMILVYEYMPRGNLSDHLYGKNHSSLTWEQRLKICIGAARGLDYLHSGIGVSERIVHLDIKSDNILIDNDWVAKVADLGLSRIGPANKPNSQVNTNTLRGTQGYMAPEYLMKNKFSSKSDVYSFGVVMLEVLSGTAVWGGKSIPISDHGEWIQQHITKKTSDTIVDENISEIYPESLRRFVNIASKMLQQDPEKRPSMNWVVVKLQSALKFQSSSRAVDKDESFEVGYQRETSSLNSEPELLGKESKVFGEPIGDNEVKQRGLVPTRANRAYVAFDRLMQVTHRKLENPMAHLEKEYANTNMNVCILYNATGETLTYVKSRNDYGGTEQFPYPKKIHNGQWGVYLREESPTMPNGFGGAVVYRVRYSDNGFRDAMVTWSIGTDDGNRAYYDIKEAGPLNDSNWDASFNKEKSAVIGKDCHTVVQIQSDIPQIESDFPPVFFAFFMQYGIRKST